MQVDADVAQAPFRGALIIGDNPAETVTPSRAFGMQAEKRQMLEPILDN